MLPFSFSQFTLLVEGMQPQVQIFPEGEPSLQGIKELQVKFTDVVGVSGATIELTLLGCSEGETFTFSKNGMFFSVQTV